jgi:SAM-dependent methyltransferase
MNLVGLGKGVTSAAMHRFERLLLRGRVSVQTAFNIPGDYQPNPFTEQPGRPDRRACRERFEAFAAKLPPGALSCIDIGCNIGYFTFRMAKRGGVCLGIEIGRNEVSYARGLATLHDVRNAAFLQFEISSQNVLALPRADVMICMSVFHHWARKFGLDEATRIMDGLAQRCQFLVFETGQHNETDTRWAQQLAFMGEDSDAWIQKYLRERGLSSVIRLGEFSTTLSAVPRHLYLAQRTAA